MIQVVVRSFASKSSGPEATGAKKSKIDTSNPNTPIGMMDRVPKKQDPQMDGSGTSGCTPPYPPFPDNQNPATGEVNGPTGPEPTRFGDWERKGRVSDF